MSGPSNSTASMKFLRAAKTGNVRRMEAALSTGIDMDVQDPEWHKFTALHWSAVKGHKNVVIKLIEAGVDIDARNYDGCSALHLSCGQGHEDIALMLMAEGAVVDAIDRDGSTPLLFASGQGYNNIIKCLLDKAGANLGHKDNNGWTAMHAASEGGHTSVVNTLAQRGADVKVETNDGEQPIHKAAFEGHNDTVSSLIQLGADINCTANKGVTPLYLACQRGRVDVVETLLRNGAQTNITSHGNQASHIAIIRYIMGDFNILKKLIHYGSDIEATTEVGQNTLLHLAVKHNRENIVKWLILNGANPYTYNAEGNSAIQLALDKSAYNKSMRELVTFMESKNLCLTRGSKPTA